MNGKRIWAKSLGLPKNHYGHSSSLINYGDILIVQYDRNDKSTIMAFDFATGNMKWETVRGAKISWASPVIATFNGVPQVILNADPFVAAYDPASGKEIWRVKSMSAEIGPSVAVNDKMVFAANEFAKLIAIKVTNEPVIAWEDNQFLPEVSSPVATNDLLFVATTYGAVACYNAMTGEVIWDHEFEYGFYSSPILNGNLVYLLDTSGVMHIFGAEKEFKSVSESPLGEKTVSTPAFSEGKIFIRGNENLYCIAGN
jgi:outer membrane protein assembly factor BamB